MEKHNLFLYLGHGCEVIPPSIVKNLEKSPAVFLLGCDSSICVLYGSYAPLCTPISYLSVGFPFLVANLWVVTDNDINTFIKAMFQAMLKARSHQCSKCQELELEVKDRGKRKIPRKKLGELSESSCVHRSSVGALMADARKSLPLMLGACTICFGVPTKICSKNNGEQESSRRRKRNLC